MRNYYNVEEVYQMLKANKITTHKESVRRWLRQGVIKGTPPSSRKEGWLVSKEALDDFLKQRLPDGYVKEGSVKEVPLDAMNVVNESNSSTPLRDIMELEKRVRADMWRELVNKNIWEGYVELKKTRIHECIQHRRFTNELEEEVWQRCVANSRAYKRPRVSYLLEAFGFEGKRLLLDQNFSSLEEQVIFSIIQYVRQTRRKHDRS
jgi:hypothetical protein